MADFVLTKDVNWPYEFCGEIGTKGSCGKAAVALSKDEIGPQ